MDYDPDNPLPSSEQGDFEKYFNVETESMAAEGYSENKEAILRKVALHVIVEKSKSFNFDAFIPYLAMNYFDRFISRHQLPNVLGLVRDDIVLAAICCLTLAWKMRDQTFRVRYLVADWKDDFKKHILDMELQILNGLNWRMRAVTAICFVLFFVGKIPVAKRIKSRTLNEIIIQAQGDISFTKFKPSVIAASALLTACRFLYPNEYDRCKGDLLASRYIKKKDLEPCLQKTYEMRIEKQIQLERNDKFKGEPRPRVEAGGTSSSISIKEPPHVISEREKQTESEPEPSSTSHRADKEPMQDISETKNEPGGSETDPNLISRRPGKEPTGEISEIMEEPGESETDLNLISRRPGKEPTGEISEIMEAPGESETDLNLIPRRPGKEPMVEISEIMKEPGESEIDPNLIPIIPRNEPMREISKIMKVLGERETETGLSFELKWRLESSDNPMEMTIDSPLFRPQAPVSDRAEPSDDSTRSATCSGCILM